MIQRIFKSILRCQILSFILGAALLMSSCSSLQTKPIEKPAEQVSFITGKPGGIKFDLGSKGNSSGNGLPVNALLWRAALDVASFVPLDDVDTFGGSIVTEWHQSSDKPDQRLKLTIFVLGVELRSEAVRVQTYTQKKMGSDWVDSGRDETLARKLEDLILTRARELRAVSVSETTQ
jgi:hypothetical protein